MSRIIRSQPRRPAWLYPVGTILELRNGRKFIVATEKIEFWYEDPYNAELDADYWSYKTVRVWKDVP